ncbi:MULTISPECIES: hypothetical protein [Flammeovirga]|uniref:Uncharacterized protein n=1 Tax=Flammeovirga agarivorans TaxID=2726742 RepID=A0A7X8XY57_9BACT|nr:MULTISPECIES: hypothetical protein [Flammeovirga]NLR93904.1 hypothetical protein [Flammeovirga agarivorans]
MSIIVIQAVASAISLPTEMDNINIHLNDGEVVSVTKKEWKKGKHLSTENTFAFVRKKEVHFIQKSDIDYVRYESFKTHEATADFMKEYAELQELKEEAIQYHHTKLHKKARFSQVLTVGALSMGVFAAPMVLIVSPVPWIQAKLRMKKVDYNYCLKGKDWSELKKNHKEKRKSLKIVKA